MAGSIVPMILDVLVICLLAGTIVYATRLSASIRAFRGNRDAFEKVIADLAFHIEKAERAIAGLRETARQSGRDLQVLVNEAQALGAELQIMTESGENLAARLEKAAQGIPRQPVSAPARGSGAVSRKAFLDFSIRDPDFDPDEMDEEGLMPGDYEEASGEQAFASRAERELYEALQKKGRVKSGAGSLS